MKGVDDLADDGPLPPKRCQFYQIRFQKVTSAHFFAMHSAFTVRTLTHRHPLGDIVARFANERRVSAGREICAVWGKPCRA
jgi:hypothetical protein